MQKNKSFQKPKVTKEFQNRSSKALLELSEITTHSRDKSSILQNLTDRSGIQPLSNLENEMNKQALKENFKLNNKKESYVKKNISLSNTVLKEIMEMSGSLPLNGMSFSSTRIKENDNDLIILSKKDLQKSKGNSQIKKSRKLLLYENKENQEKVMSKSKSSYGQALKGENILCSIKIHPMEDPKSCSHLSSTQKRDSFDGRRSSFSSRRSSIRLFPQDNSTPEEKIREIKKSFIAKISAEDCHDYGQFEKVERVENFLKKAQENFEPRSKPTSNEKAIISRETRPNDTEITPGEKKEKREKLLFKLDELNIIEEDIKKDAFKFINIWDDLIHAERNLKKHQSYFPEVKTRYEELQIIDSSLKNMLYEENKQFVMKKKMSSNSENLQKQNILLEAERIHTEVKKKVFKKDLEDMMIFNMKVVMPSSEMMESSISCLSNHINSTISFSNMTVLQLYEELINQKACKKYGMILKKEINNMNIYDSRTMNDYLRRLYELENGFHRIQTEDPQNEINYLEKIENLVNKIELTEREYEEVNKEYIEIERRIKENERIRHNRENEKEILLQEMSESIFSEYKIFQTGGKLETPNKEISEDNEINESFSENDKTIEEFRELVSKKYEVLYNRYKQIKEEKTIIEESLKNNEYHQL